MNFKICVIGCGEMSSAVHGPSLARYAATHPGAKLAACCDLDERKAIDYQQKFGFANHYTDMVKMLDREKPDAVCLIVPEALTSGLACKVFDMGYPMICEKPPGRIVDEIDRMIAMADISRVPNQVAFNRRYTPLIVKLKTLTAQTLGQSGIQHVRYEFTRVRRIDEDFTLTAIHGIDAVRFIAGSDYRHISFHYQHFPELSPTVANVYMDCVFESGSTGHLSFCPVCGISSERAVVHAYDHSYIVELPMWPRSGYVEGSLRYIHMDQTKLVLRDRDIEGADEQYIAGGFYDENASFFDDLQSGRNPDGDLKSARQSVEVMQCMRERVKEYTKGEQR